MGLTIKEVSEKFNIPSETLRYYERVGVIPPVTRTASGIRNYQEEDLAWVENAKCFRAAGLSIEALIEYLKLYSEGNSTFQARLDLLNEQRAILLAQQKQLVETLDRLDYKISKYESAVKTGKLTWD
ncbi:MerR family transcriptional regulator [Thomasclavelia cocleata]|jgi:DNA-binding transcriptional MerR regulator|uniref:DNA-binding transcriptional regulator, MerR family n=1 Tax=Thomasclavelia cocleata TaxID=69824 RepID=A0A1I0FXD9_9FIRM|nr:MerR family transcriptional regulator [Thomasclavelia cocleata]MCR1961493.1 MerR family transcriptional regulator [Thomasclavelia cocleata]NDO42322.1 MerR family transcriptional regulator [Thomasclavelia cocleata]PJN80254.1 MerR family transcriptional regulator [Thomasclavelia cocleata]SET63029.1 DNA-binding transcriptional regulator, MerR family [Thomasclavelia cocleata]GFI40293.1 HTH-type transcriptional regulator AdhR [Thomasclavelia cocleata]